MLRIPLCHLPGITGWAVISSQPGNRLEAFAVDDRLEFAAEFDGEATTFFPGHAVVQFRAADAWTAEAFTLPPPIRLPMDVYVCSDSDADLCSVRDHVANLNYLLNGRNGAGIVFDAELRVIPPDTFERIPLGCPHVEELKESQYYTEGRLNVYYHGQSVYRNGPPLSAACDHDVIFMRPYASIDTLAHEAGHALGIRAAKENGYDDDVAPASWYWNVMQLPGARLAEHFSLGQMYNMRFSELSLATRCPSGSLAASAAVPGAPSEIPWTFDAVARQPRDDGSADCAAPGTGQVEGRRILVQQLVERHVRLSEYWRPAAPGLRLRPEGQLGHAGKEDFVRCHLPRQLGRY